jgi:hypothetical protein
MAETLKGLLDSVNAHVIMAWLLLAVPVMAWSGLIVMPDEATFTLFGLGVGKLNSVFEKVGDGK